MLRPTEKENGNALFNLVAVCIFHHLRLRAEPMTIHRIREALVMVELDPSADCQRDQLEHVARHQLAMPTEHLIDAIQPWLAPLEGQPFKKALADLLKAAWLWNMAQPITEASVAALDIRGHFPIDNRPLEPFDAPDGVGEAMLTDAELIALLDAPTVKSCPVCGGLVKAKRSTKKFCSEPCRRKAK